ncbi:MAG: hypothetical protein M1840_000709 [Geoglossum simile]|nr:MAG: hypothetical protein M1840_000709 [Geoglossum simile]
MKRELKRFFARKPNVEATTECSTQSTRQYGESSQAREPRSLCTHDQDEYGIKILYSPKEPIADIVFVHGLTGGQVSTWTAERANASWPKLLLSEDIPEARISAFGYDADVVKFLGQAGQHKIRQHAINLLAGLADMRFETGFTELPVIFVAHSLGGLVCENALTIAANSEQHQKHILDYTRAIAFLGTPHRGSELANWATIAGNMINVLKRTNIHILKTLKPESEVLEIITQEFHRMLKSREEGKGTTINITCYAEELAVSRLGNSFMVVPLPSAILERYPYKTIHSDHINMTKFEKRDDGYKKVYIELKRWVGDAKVPNIASEPKRIHTPDEDLLRLVPCATNAPFSDRRDSSFCLPNTRVDILRQIREWADGHDERCIFWLSGMAGTGKSTIARTIARDYHGLGRLGASFFFSRGGGDVSRADKFLTTIASQLASRSPSLKHFICEAVAKHGDIAIQNLSDQWSQLILQPLSKLKASSLPNSLVLVIDALDECEDENDVWQIIELLAEARVLRTVRLRILITSRPETPIRHCLGHIPEAEHQDFVLHEISPPIIDCDITVFLKYKFETIRRQRALPVEWPGEQAIERLVQNASGLFIWAATACQFVMEGRQFAGERLSLILQGNSSKTKPEEKLNDIYITVLTNSIRNEFSDHEKEEQYKMLRTSLGAIVIIFSPLSIVSLARLLHIPKETISRTLDDLHAILDIPKDQGHPIRLHHSSFRDFLLDRRRCGNYFLVDGKEAHQALAKSCLRLMSDNLKRDICDLQAPGALINDVQSSRVEQCLPADLQYACRYWAQHLQRSEAVLCDNDQVHTFLREHLLHWLEALSLIGELSESIQILINLQSAVPDSNSELHAIIYDARRFVLYNRSIIEVSPLQIYYSALVFAPEKSAVRKQFLDQPPQWTYHLPEVEDDWSSSLLILEGHSGLVNTVVFSPDGQLLASASADNIIRLWDTKTGAPIATFKGHSGSVTAVAFSLDGRLLASASDGSAVRLWRSKRVAPGSSDSTVRLWDLKAGAPRGILKGHSNPINDIAFSPDSQLLASASSDSTIRLWDSKTGAPRGTLEGHFLQVNAVAFSLDGHLLASASCDCTVRLWDPKTGAPQGTLRGHSSLVSTVAFSPDGQLLASASDDSTRLWDSKTGVLRGTLEGYSHIQIPFPHPLRPANATAFSPDGKLLASVSQDSTIRLWDSKTGAPLSTLVGHSSSVNTVAFSPDGQLLASASMDRAVRLWDPKTGAPLGTLEGHSGPVTAVAFSPDSQLLASASWDSTVRLWDSKTEAPRGIREGHSNGIDAVAFSPDGHLLASASCDSTVRLWDPKTGSPQGTLEGHSGPVTAVAFSPDCHLLASASWDSTIRLWDLKTGAPLGTLEGHSGPVTAVAFSPDGYLLASASRDCSVRLWDPKTGAPQDTLEGHSGAVNTVAFSPDGQLLASASNDDTIRLWDLKTGASRSTIQSYSHLFNVAPPPPPWTDTIAFSPDGQLLASSLRGSIIGLWDSKTGASRGTLEGHSSFVDAMTFSPDGQLLASASCGDSTVRLWDSRTSETVQILDIEDRITSLSFSGEGSYLETNRGVLDLSSPPSLPF